MSRWRRLGDEPNIFETGHLQGVDHPAETAIGSFRHISFDVGAPSRLGFLTSNCQQLVGGNFAAIDFNGAR